MNQREIAKILNVSSPAVSKTLPSLIEWYGGTVVAIKDPKMNLTSIKLNRDNPRAIELKRIENLKNIYLSGLLDFLEETFPGSTIILFGSYSRGDDINTSDIDVAIIGSKPKEVNLSEFEHKMERDINLQFYPELKKVHKQLRENLCNGIVLAGGIQL